VLPSSNLDGLPVEVLAEGRTVSHAPSGTLYAHLRGLPRSKGDGLLALADPVFERPAPDKPPALPPGGLLVTLVSPGSKAARAGLRAGDVLLKYADVEVKGVAELTKALAAHARSKSVELTFWREGKTATRTVAGGPLGVALDRRPARALLEERYKTDRLIRSVRDGERWGALPGTRVEADGLRKLLGAKRVTLLVDAEASEQRLDELSRSGALGKYRYLHFGTHGTTALHRPLQSALILSQDNLPDPLRQLESGQPAYDGRLTAEKVLRNWRLDCDLVTLSACQTGLGKHELGEGFLGLAQAFLLAGSRSVVVSLWKVDDGATALLMGRFYENLLGKDGKGPLGKAEALAEARQWLRDLTREEALKRWAAVQDGVVRGKGRPRLPLLPELPRESKPRVGKGERPYAHPYYWAAFVLVGDPR
jgi:CHAT domain-containing protein